MSSSIQLFLTSMFFIYLKNNTTFWQVKVPFCNLSIYPILFNVHYCDMDSSAAVMSL